MNALATHTRRGARPTSSIAVGLAAAVAVVLLVIPLVGIVKAASWSTLAHDATSPRALDAIRLSVVCALAATVLSIVLGFPLAWVLARTHIRGRGVIRALVLVPLVLPPVVGGVALVSAFGRQGLVGQHLFDWFGIQLTYTTTGAVLAQTFVAMPFFVLTVDAALRSSDMRLEQVAATLGASRSVSFRRVTLPLILPSVVAGAVLACARALGEFGATATFAGNIAGSTQTLPLAVYEIREAHPEEAMALSLVLLAVSCAVIVGLRNRWLVRS